MSPSCPHTSIRFSVCLKSTSPVTFPWRKRWRRAPKPIPLLVGTHTTALADLQGHRTAHHVARGQILRCGRVARHEGLAFALAGGLVEIDVTFEYWKGDVN